MTREEENSVETIVRFIKNLFKVLFFWLLVTAGLVYLVVTDKRISITPESVVTFFEKVDELGGESYDPEDIYQSNDPAQNIREYNNRVLQGK